MTRAIQSFSSKTRAKYILLDKIRGRHVAPRAPYSPYSVPNSNKVKQQEVSDLLARPEGFEPPTPRFVVWCSIQLSYGRVLRIARECPQSEQSRRERASSYRLRPAMASSPGAERRTASTACACPGCGAARQRCTADPGPSRTETIPGLRRITSRCAAPGTRLLDLASGRHSRA